MKTKPILVQLIAELGTEADELSDILSRELQTFLNPNRHFGFVVHDAVCRHQDATFKRAMTESSAHAGVQALKRQAAAYVLAGLRADAEADVSVRLLYGLGGPPQDWPEENFLWSRSFAVVGMLGARFKEGYIVLYPSVHTAPPLGKRDIDPRQVEEMSLPVIKGLVQGWRRDYVREALAAKKTA